MKEGICVTLFGVLVFMGAGCVHQQVVTRHAKPKNAPPNAFEVVRVVDGDTLVVDDNGHNEKVRFLGINAPESVDPRRPVECFGRVASRYVKKLLPHGSYLLMTTDPLADDRDKYGRLLRYLFIADPHTFATGTDVDALMVAEGYAYAYTQFPLSRNEEFLAIQATARAAGRGLWALDTCDGKK